MDQKEAQPAAAGGEGGRYLELLDFSLRSRLALQRATQKWPNQKKKKWSFERSQSGQVYGCW